MSTARHVRLLQDGDRQTVEIPADLKMPGDEVVIRKEGDRLVLEPVGRKSLSKVLASLKPLDVDFPEIEDLPTKPIDLFPPDSNSSNGG